MHQIATPCTPFELVRMVQFMVIKFLDLTQTVNFINQYGYNFNVMNITSDSEFFKLIKTLNHEKRLDILFHYQGNSETEIKVLIKGGYEINETSIVSDIDGFFYLYDIEPIKKILDLNEYIVNENSIFEPFSLCDNPVSYVRFDDYSLDRKYVYHLSPYKDFKISLEKIRFSREQLLKIFDYEKSESYQQSVQFRVVNELSKENEVLNEMLTEYKVLLEDIFGNELSIKSEQSYLATIGLLLELLQKTKLVGRHEVKIFPSQAQIIEEIITNYDIYGQKKANLEDRFSKANDALNQALKAKVKLSKLKK